MNDTGGVIRAFLVSFAEDLHIISTLELTLRNFSLNQTKVECLSQDLGSDAVYVDINLLGMYDFKCTCLILFKFKFVNHLDLILYLLLMFV